MGVVYLARDLRLNRLVALKVLHRQAVVDSDRKMRFMNEARAACTLNHPNIVTIYDVGSAEGIDFIAMEYVEGRTLAECIARRELSVDQAVSCMVQVADALTAAHQKGIIHRDLKPANLIFGAGGRVRILDFGVAKLTDPEEMGDSTLTADQALVTQPGTIVGTLAYISPEQAEGKPIDVRADIFSFGAVLYELITGRPAFARASPAETLAAILRDEPPPINEVVTSLPAGLSEFTARCLHKRPAQRFQTAAELKAALEGASSELRSAGRRAGESAAGASIAVLPFADMSPQRDQEYFCDGLAEEIINALTKVEGLRVASRTSSFQFKGKAEDIGKIGAQLRAEVVLEGSVRSAGEHVRITAQLVNAADGYHLWSERYDRDLKDVFAIQEEIAQAVVDTLLRSRRLSKKAALPPKRYTPTPQAYDLYLRGRHYWHHWSEESMRRAIDYLERAVSEDPKYAAAYALLGDSCGTLCYWGGAPKATWQKARAAATRALQLDDALAEAHATLGMIRSLHDFDWWGAERAFCRALELDPNCASARTWFATHLYAMGRVDEGLECLQHAREVDPLSIAVNGSIGIGLYYKQRYNESVEQWKKTLELDSRHPRAYYYLGRTYLAKGMLAEAVETLRAGRELAGNDRRIVGVLGHALATRGDQEAAEKLLEGLEALPCPAPHAALSMAFIYLGLARPEQALDALERVYDESPDLLRWLKVDPLFDSLRSNTCFAALVKKMAL